MKTIILPAFILFSFEFHDLFAQSDSIYLWHGAVPDAVKPKAAPIPSTLEDGSIRVIEVTDPFIAVFQPKPSIRNGKAIIVCPGGAYVRLAVHKEGYATADWLSDLGYTVFVLHYRVPNQRTGALQDFQRALRIVRHKAKQYEIDPSNIGCIGFSAGAHVVASAGMRGSLPSYTVQDDADKQRAMPDKMILIYPAYLDAGPNRTLSTELKASGHTVDTFIFQTMDDNNARSALAVAIALQEAKANVELHMLPKGGHGYGMSPGNYAAETWPKLLQEWLAKYL